MGQKAMRERLRCRGASGDPPCTKRRAHDEALRSKDGCYSHHLQVRRFEATPASIFLPSDHFMAPPRTRKARLSSTLTGMIV